MINVRGLVCWASSRRSSRSCAGRPARAPLPAPPRRRRAVVLSPPRFQFVLFGKCLQWKSGVERTGVLPNAGRTLRLRPFSAGSRPLLLPCQRGRHRCHRPSPATYFRVAARRDPSCRSAKRSCGRLPMLALVPSVKPLPTRRTPWPRQFSA